MTTRYVCDGCEGEIALSDLKFVVDYGHESRYCLPCAEIYAGWQLVRDVEEARRQRELDLWQLTMREKVPLKRMPMDFGPGRCVTPKPMILG